MNKYLNAQRNCKYMRCDINDFTKALRDEDIKRRSERNEIL